MCKVLILAGIKPKQEARAWNFIINATPPMTKTDKDGYGYAAYSRGVGIWGEKWLDVKTAWKDRDMTPKDLRDYVKDLGDAVNVNANFSSFGRAAPMRVSTICAHARFATCGVSLANTHPFYDAEEDVALIHNGVISNQDDFILKQSSCDSEAVLRGYLEHKINRQPENVQSFIDSLEGSFACAVLAKVGARYVVDIFKNSATNLYVAKVPKLGAYAFSTADSVLHIAAKGSKLKLGPVVEFKSNVFLRLDAVTGERLFSTTFKHVDRPSWQRGIYPSSSFTIGKDKDTSERIGNVGELDLHGSLDSDTNRFDAKTMEGI